MTVIEVHPTDSRSVRPSTEGTGSPVPVDDLMHDADGVD